MNNMMGGMSCAGWMMAGMGVALILLFLVLVLGIAGLVKYLKN